MRDAGVQAGNWHERLPSRTFTQNAFMRVRRLHFVKATPKIFGVVAVYVLIDALNITTSEQGTAPSAGFSSDHIRSIRRDSRTTTDHERWEEDKVVERRGDAPVSERVHQDVLRVTALVRVELVEQPVSTMLLHRVLT